MPLQAALRGGVVRRGTGGFESELTTGRRNFTLVDDYGEPLAEQQPEDMVGRMMNLAQQKAEAAERGEVYALTLLV